MRLLIPDLLLGALFVVMVATTPPSGQAQDVSICGYLSDATPPPLVCYGNVTPVARLRLTPTPILACLRRPLE